MQRKIQIGSVPYLVARPLTWGLDKVPYIQLEYQPPSQLVAGLQEGRIDIALASSVAVCRLPECNIVPNIAIASRGEVLSVRLFLRKPLASVQSIALDPCSRTAAILLQILAKNYWQREILWNQLTPQQDPMQTADDAFLLIGDPALQQAYLGKYDSLDLGQVWNQWTGLPFVFALWIVRPNFVLEQKVTEQLQQAATLGMQQRKAIVERASHELDLPEDYLYDYLLRACHYQLGAAEQQGLQLFHKYVRDLDSM